MSRRCVISASSVYIAIERVLVLCHFGLFFYHVDFFHLCAQVKAMDRERPWLLSPEVMEASIGAILCSPISADALAAEKEEVGCVLFAGDPWSQSLVRCALSLTKVVSITGWMCS